MYTCSFRVCIHIHTLTHKHTPVPQWAWWNEWVTKQYTYLHTNIFVCICLYKYAWIHTHTQRMYTCVYMYVCMYTYVLCVIYIYVCTLIFCVNIHTHTHTNQHTPLPQRAWWHQCAEDRFRPLQKDICWFRFSKSILGFRYQGLVLWVWVRMCLKALCCRPILHTTKRKLMIAF